jgi:hypothetical protein
MTIGTLSEKSLHADLKSWYALPDDDIEVVVDGYHIDIVRDQLLIEIQTAHFSAIKRKLRKLLPHRTIRLVYPIPLDRWIVRVDKNDKQIKRRKSPKHGRLDDLFDELVRIPALAAEPNLTIEVLFVQDEIVWKNDGKGSWRRKGWSLADRRLLSVLDSKLLKWPDSYLDFLPPSLQKHFTNKDLAKTAGASIPRARKITYCLERMGLIDSIGHRDRYKVYTLVYRNDLA